MLKLNAKQLRASNPESSLSSQKEIKRIPLVLVLDNVYDTFNIGSFFRLADALAVEKIYLCGQVVTPPNIKIHRASIGTWKWVPWEHSYSTLETVTRLKQQGYQILGVEQSKTSQNYQDLIPQGPTALVLGNETNGISLDILRLCHKHLEITMWGVNKSLNVLVAGSVIAYHVAEFLHQKPIINKKK